MSGSRTLSLALVSTLLGAAAFGCSDDDDTTRRVVPITQTDDSCTPTTIDLAAGEKVKFEVKNEGGKDREVEGIEGTKLEEVLVPSGKTRNLNFTAPSKAGTGKIKCYVPGGNTAVIELKVS